MFHKGELNLIELLLDADYDVRAGSSMSEASMSKRGAFKDAGYNARRRGVGSGVCDDGKNEQGKLLEGKRMGG